MREIETPDGLLILTDDEYQHDLKRGGSVKRNRQLAKAQKEQKGQTDHGIQTE